MKWNAIPLLLEIVLSRTKGLKNDWIVKKNIGNEVERRSTTFRNCPVPDKGFKEWLTCKNNLKMRWNAVSLLFEIVLSRTRCLKNVRLVKKFLEMRYRSTTSFCTIYSLGLGFRLQLFFPYITCCTPYSISNQPPPFIAVYRRKSSCKWKVGWSFCQKKWGGPYFFSFEVRGS